MKPTASQLTILHAGESALASAALTVGAGVYQYVTSQSLNLPGLLAFLGATFLGAMAMIYKSLLANPALPQAEADTVNEVIDFLSKDFAQFVGGHLSGLSQQVKDLETTVANHSHMPLPTAPAPSSVPQLSFPSQPSVPFQVTSGGTTANVPPALAQGGVIKPGTMAIVGDGTPPLVVPSFSGSTVTNVPVQPAPQPQAPMLNTYPTLTAVPKQ